MPACTFLTPVRSISLTHHGRAKTGVALACVAAGALLVGHEASAQIKPAVRGGDVIEHRVLAGDTLEQLATRYLGDRTRWTALQAHNQVSDPFRLRPGSMLEIPTRLLRAASASVE